MLISYIFIIVSLLVLGIEIVLAHFAWRHHSRVGNHICAVFTLSALVNVFYLFSVLCLSYPLMSFFSSVYFSCIDLLLLSLLSSILAFINISMKPSERPWLYGLLAYGAFDILVLMTNPIHEAALCYIPRTAPIAFYSYDMHILGRMHLAYSYLLVVIIILRMLYQTIKVPQGYRRQYLYPLGGMTIIVLINALFLFLPGLSIINFLDYSIWLYGFGGMLFYWTIFRYSKHGMLNRFKNDIFENIDQGLIMFDYQEHLILKNARAEQLLRSVDWKKTPSFSDFLQDCSLPEELSHGGEDYSIQCFQSSGKQPRPLRCDYRPLKNRRRQIIGRLFVFSDMTTETDLLTGFLSHESHQQSLMSGDSPRFGPLCAAVCDINNLAEINRNLGRNTGDQAIRALSELLLRNFPDNSLFIRGREADLIVLCPHETEEQVQMRLQRVSRQLRTAMELPFSLEMQSAVCCATDDPDDIDRAIWTAARTLRSKKLMDERSSHSVQLSSLIRALKECDHDTEAHVLRTQNMGVLLGRRIGLTDAQQSDLALLCILHDIGKIGVPLEILNKPGKLTEAEWNVLKTHVMKGEQIARGSADLAGIADMIRHHHERWDGNGYPDGLKGDNIPLLSRVIAVVDAYDAMVNTRSYRQALSPDKVRAELLRCAGTQFDPAIVKAFLVMVEEDLPKQEEKQETNPRAAAYSKLAAGNSTDSFIHPVRFSRYIVDETDRILSADGVFTELTGYTQEDVQKGNLFQSDLIFPEERADYLSMSAEMLSREHLAYFEHRIRRKNGSVLYVMCYGKQFYDSAARAPRSEIVITDIMDTRSLHASLPALPFSGYSRTDCDPRTGLLTHKAFRQAVEQYALLRPSRIMILMFRIDGCQSSTQSELDAVLMRVAGELAADLRHDDLPCLFGADCLAAALFFSGDTQNGLLYRRAQQICDRLNRMLDSSQSKAHVTAGGTISGHKYRNPDELFAAAGHALLQADSRRVFFSDEE